MIISLLPTTALAAEKNNVWSTAYDEIRIYLDEETKKDLKDLDGTIREVRIISSKYTEKDGDGNRMRLCLPLNGYWWTENLIRKVAANYIRRIDLARDKPIGSSPTISIPIGGDTTYKVKVSQGHQKGKIILGNEWGGYDYLRIDITKRTHRTVNYVFSGTADVDYPASVTPPASEQATATTKVTLPDVKTPITGTLNGQDGIWTFKGWTLPDGVTFTDDTHAKFTMPDTNVTVTGTWTFEATPPTGTPVYVYFRTVNTKNELVKVESGVTYNANGSSWATLGKLTTEQTVAVSTDKIEVGKLGAEVKDASDDPNTTFERYKVNENVINGNVGISLIDWESIVLEPNGAAGYESEAPYGTNAWHLNGKVNVYKLSYNANLPTGVDEAAVTGMPKPAYYLPNATVSTDDPTLQGYNFGGWYEDSDCKIKAGEKVTVAEDTSLYAKWKPITADLIDNDIIIKHGVNDDPVDDVSDSTAHIVNKNAKISYKAELDLSEMNLQMNKRTASIIAVYGEKPWEKLVEAVREAKDSLAMFSGSEIVLHVQLDKQLSTADIQKQLNKITVTSDWFELSKGGDSVAYDKNAQSLTITCVPKDEADGYSSTITLSGLNDLSLTDKAQGELSSGTELDVVSEGYIDGTIKIYTHELSLIGRSKEDPAKNIAKLKLAVPTYTVTYHANGGSGTMTDTNSPYAYEVVAKVLTNGFTRSRYTFTGWNTKPDGTGDSYAEGDSIKMRDNVTLYAQWTRNSSHDDDDSKTYYYFAIEKVDAQDDHALNGAKFELYQLDKDGKVVNHSETKTRQHSSENGIALFSVSATKTNEGGDTWYYREITAPEGYVLDSTEHKIKAKNFSDSRSAAVSDADTVWNYRGTTPDLLNGDDHFAYVVGYQDGCVHPNALITRAETATIFFRLLKDSVRDGNLLTSNTFADVPNAYWANTAISTMAGLGIVQGYNSTAFDPNASITRAEFAAICARFDTGKSSGTQTFSDIKGHWAEKYIERAAELGWIKGFEDGTFRPNDCITRAQAMTMINRVLNRIPEDASDLLPDMNVWPDCNPGDWFYLAVQEATNSHDFKHKAGNYETWTSMSKDPDWTRYEN